MELLSVDCTLYYIITDGAVKVAQVWSKMCMFTRNPDIRTVL